MADEEKVDQAQETPPEPPKWEYRTEFKIHGQMRTVVEKALEFAEKERESLLRKLDRLTYGG
jgi:hypothetical protein